MQRRVLFVSLAVVLLVAVFGAGSAYAAACYTDFTSPIACWMRTNNIAAPYPDGSYRPTNYLTRGDAANFLYKANRVPPSVGDIHIVQALSGLTPDMDFLSGRVGYLPGAAVMLTSGAASNYYQFYLQYPTSVYGRATRLKGVQVCYDATGAGVSLNLVLLTLYNTSPAGSSSIVNSVQDATVRTDKACRKYLFTTPSLTSGSNHAAVYLGATFTDPSQLVLITSVAAILSPSMIPATLNAADAPADGVLPPDPGMAP